MRKPNALTISIAIIIVVIGLAASHFLGLLKKPPKRKISTTNSAILVETTPLEFANEPAEIIGYGSVKPRIGISIPAEVSGKIIYRNPELEEGNLIASGQVLFKIDPESYKFRMQSSEAQVAQFKSQLIALEKEIEGLKKSFAVTVSQLDLQKLELNRYKKLNKKNAISDSQMEKVKSAYQNALSANIRADNTLTQAKARKKTILASLSQVKSSLNEAKLNLSRTVITAPFDAKVDLRNKELNEYVNPGQVLCRLHDPDTYEIESPIGLQDILWLTQDQGTAFIKNTKVLIELIHPNNSSKKCVWEGKVTRISADSDIQTRTFGVFVKVLDQIKKQSDFTFPMSSGLFVKLIFKGKNLDKLFKIPRYLVSTDNNINIYNGGKLRICPVTIVEINEGFAYIRGEIKENEELITTTLSRVIDGMNLKKKSSLSVSQDTKTLTESNIAGKERR